MSGTVTRISRSQIVPVTSGAPAPQQPVRPPAPVPSTLSPDAPPSITYATRLPRDSYALTFDDGPNPATTPQVLAILAEHGAKATFFVTGQNAARYPELVRQIVAEGHELGSHTWNHPQLTKLSASAIESQLDRTQQAVDQALGYPYPLTQVRPPYGANNATVRATLAARGASMVLWQVDSNDWRYKANDPAILHNTLTGPAGLASRGGVVLFHDVHPQTVRVLDTVLKYAADHHLTGTTTGAYLQASRQPAASSQP